MYILLLLLLLTIHTRHQPEASVWYRIRWRRAQHATSSNSTRSKSVHWPDGTPTTVLHHHHPWWVTLREPHHQLTDATLRASGKLHRSLYPAIDDGANGKGSCADVTGRQ
uniref:Putative secreted protein n=1 Tax=Anopheles darlingi TaxID=43151 RepID=A0A2M4DD46_ANODA